MSSRADRTATHDRHSRHAQHVDIERLSAYLDREIDLAEARAVEAHLADCLDCRRRLDGLKGVVAGLGRLEREAPPPWLALRIRNAAEAPLPGLWEQVFRPLLQLARRSPVGSTLSMASALAVIFLLVTSGDPEPVAFPDTPIETTIVVAGRTFVRRDLLLDDVWVEEGLGALSPEARVRVSSPQGRALLARYSDLGYLLADGSRVFLRDKRETLELWSGI